MVFVFGVVLFALAIGISVALHECGHMWMAKAFGMKVRRYYIGFGPKIFSFRRGETEYGLKAIPAGGFCDIAGMTALDEIEPDEISRAMYKQAAWKRIMVMLAGVGMNIVLGIALIYTMAMVWGLPDLNATPKVTVDQTTCIPATQTADGKLAPCTGTGPAGVAGVRHGDVITSVDGTAVSDGSALAKQVKQAHDSVTLGIDRSGEHLTVTVPIEQVQRYTAPQNGKPAEPVNVGMIGISMSTVMPAWGQYNALSAVPATFGFTGDLAVKSWDGLMSFPQKIPPLFDSITGGQRSDDTPISVVGASRIGGEFAEQDAWSGFVLLLAQLNFFLALVNLLPLLPFDGGHIAVTVYEKARNAIRRSRGLSIGAPVDYTKLMPVTLTVVVLLGGIMLLTVTADIVNPIRLN
ncbi:site-2 protease family protein [Speluncibacter jeojiensis]|uniref:Zinc metalloprotease Rip1 n=1 Tax=Speluncibacter jeojiensis TaxID=2710754 RepID=A0A9X4LXA8_9ACTN|nr:site-2 protease family protein [Corynebacteriales bacterium D3-21]